MLPIVWSCNSVAPRHRAWTSSFATSIVFHLIAAMAILWFASASQSSIVADRSAQRRDPPTGRVPCR